jgi:uncharacterized lipoprotein YbaY
MRKVSFWAVLGLFALALAGCNSDASSPQDDAFQKNMADAAAQNKGAGAGKAKMSRGALPPEVSGKGSTTPPPTNTTAGC